MKDISKEQSQELREMARLAFRNSVGATEDDAVSFNYRDYSTLDLNFLWHFKALALEEAAKECDAWASVEPFSDFSQGSADGAKNCAAAIRRLK